jgi:hypothetical protein
MRRSYTQLDPSKKYLEQINERVIQQNDDRVIIVLGDEGVGKSTYMLFLARIWKDCRDRDNSPDAVLDSMIWGERSDFATALRERDPGSMICVQDAPHVLFRREAMHGDQIQIEKNLLDIRIKNFLIVLGFQDFRDVPSSLMRRRAENILHIPYRGVVRAYGRSAINERVSENEWPDNPDFEDRFPSLEGTKLWERFTNADREAKLNRLDDLDDEPEPENVARQEQIKTALRAVKPWSDDGGMTYREASKLTDYSRNWVSDRVHEWRDGEHESLIGQSPNENPQTTS